MTAKAFATTFAALLFSAVSSPLLAQDNMMAEGTMMMEMDPMAEECFTKAHAETDMMKMDTMMSECVAMYPDAAPADCYNHAHMEADAMKMEEMMAACTEKYPDAMAAMTGAM
jgi:uncharacterized protein YqfB (UPF0267 family)